MDSFIHKCNEVVQFFDRNRLKLNLGKSGFLIINPKANDDKRTIFLNADLLKYKPNCEYLGVFLSDNGSLKHDVKLYIDHERANVSIKFTNFCKVNRNTPLSVKLEVLQMCIICSQLWV